MRYSYKLDTIEDVHNVKKLTFCNKGVVQAEGHKATLKATPIDRCEIAFEKVARCEITFEKVQDVKLHLRQFRM